MLSRLVLKVLAPFMGLTIGLLSLHAAATTFHPRLDESEWQVEASIFECRMTHPIPFYGDAVFKRRAGESARFNLASKTPRLKTGKASIVSETPLWRPGLQPKELAMVSVKQGGTPVSLGSALAEQMLAELHAGRKVVVTRKPWYGADESLKVSMSSVNFRAAYRRYLDCLGALLPVNFDQIKRTAIYFPSGSDELKPSEMQKLDNLIVYVNADPSVEAFYIDGHTDSVGKRSDNLELSKYRAEMVSEYLSLKGVPKNKITTRWHGERYQVTTNRTRKGRAKNRRVTIRLEKAGEPKVPALARGNFRTGAQ